MDPVQEQLEAYNAQDAERFVACYTEDVVIEDADGTVTMQGRAAMRERYAQLFARYPQQHCRVVTRIRIGEHVIDEERIAGRGPEEAHAVAIYRLTGDLIGRVRFLR